jgi:hypothetical protein
MVIGRRYVVPPPDNVRLPVAAPKVLEERNWRASRGSRQMGEREVL